MKVSTMLIYPQEGRERGGSPDGHPHLSVTLWLLSLQFKGPSSPNHSELSLSFLAGKNFFALQPLWPSVPGPEGCLQWQTWRVLTPCRASGLHPVQASALWELSRADWR